MAAASLFVRVVMRMVWVMVVMAAMFTMHVFVAAICGWHGRVVVGATGVRIAACCIRCMCVIVCGGWCFFLA